MNISKADFDKLKEKSEKDGEEQVITIQGIFATMDTDEHAKKLSLPKYRREGRGAVGGAGGRATGGNGARAG